MKQKLFNLMVTVCMLLTLLPLSATTIHGADLVSVTFDGTTNNYASFEDAWAAAVAIDETNGVEDLQSSANKPITIKLLADVTATSAVSNVYGGYLNLDTNSHTLTFSADVTNSCIVKNYGYLDILGGGTIKGSISSSSGGILESDFSAYVYAHNVTITNTNSSTDSNCVYLKGSGGYLGSYDSTINSSGFCAKLLPGSQGSNIYLYGGKFSGGGSSIFSVAMGCGVYVRSTLAAGLVLINNNTASIASNASYMKFTSAQVNTVQINYGNDTTGVITTSTTDKTWSNVNSNKYVKVVTRSYAATAPTITTNLTETTDSYNVGQTATALSVIASASGTLSYQWYKNTSNSTSGGTVISGATSNSYTPDISTVGTSYYYCVVTNTVRDSVTNTATATSKVKPVTVTNLTQVVASDFTFTAPADLNSDGNAKSATVVANTGKTAGAVTIKYIDSNNNSSTTPPIKGGTYKVKIDVAANGNFASATDLTDSSWTFTIINPDVTSSDFTLTGSDTEWNKTDLTITPTNGYTKVSTDGTTWVDSLTLSTTGSNSSVTFYLLKANGVQTKSKTLTYKLDKDAPSGDITFNSSSVKKAISDIGFNLYYKDDITVVITGTDSTSSVTKTQYYKSTTVLTQSEVEAVTSWTDYSSLSLAATDGSKVIIYVKLTDAAGNIAYLGSNGVTFDKIAPTISGVENDETYYSTQKATAADTNLKEVKLGSNTVTSPVTITGNTNATYTLVAEDKAGNKTTYTIKMKPISELSNALSTLDEDSVTSDNETIVTSTLKKAEDANASTSATTAEKNLLNPIITKASTLKIRLAKVKAALSTDSIEAVKNVTTLNVTKEDLKNLKQAKLDLTNALATYEDNLTTEELQQLQADLQRIELALPKAQKLVDTGDYNSPVMWFDITVVSIGLAITLWKRRKRKA